MAYLLMLCAAALASVLFAGLALLSMPHGPQYYAWLFILPALPIALIAAHIPYLRWQAAATKRRLHFVVQATILTTVLSVVAVMIFNHGSHTQVSGDTVVYVQDPPVVELQMPAKAVVGEKLLARGRTRSGDWIRIRYVDLERPEYRGRIAWGEPQPVEYSDHVDADWLLKLDLGSRVESQRFNEDTGKSVVSFDAPGVYRVWAEDSKQHKSNEITVQVSAR
jgi:hypothetical protein